jgi:hypothetical protein
MKKNIKVITSKGNFYYFIKQYDRKYYVYKEGMGFFESDKEIGKANSFEDAITIAKMHAPGNYEKIEIS